MFTDNLCLLNKNKRNVYKIKVYKNVIFIKQQFTDKLWLLYKTKVYKHVTLTKQNKWLQHKCLQIKVYKHVMFTKQNIKQNVYKTKLKSTNTLCLQNKTNVYKTKVYKHVMFTKQNTKQKVYKTKQMFTYKVYLQNRILNRKFTKQN